MSLAWTADSDPPANVAGHVPPATVRRPASLRALGWLMAAAITTGLLYFMPQRDALAPIIEADNAYIFLAADRLYAGDGATTIPPRAPLQPWTWQADWVFLTQWPVGYPALICAVRWLTGLPTVSAAVALSVVCSAVALVAWFAWGLACLPRRFPAPLIAIVAAGATFSMNNLVNPASDTVLLAALPLVLLLTGWALGWNRSGMRRGSPLRLVIAGLVAGLLCWVRYAAVFAPVAIGFFLLIEWCVLRRVRMWHVIVFAVAAALPITSLVAMNRALGSATSAQEQFNLGHEVSWDIQPEVFATAWMKFTQQTPYAHRPEAKLFYALVLPAGGIGLALLARRTQKKGRISFSDTDSPMLLSATCVIVLLAMLIAVSVLFQGKYNYVGLARYYQPVRPLYFLLFIGPIAALRWGWLRAAACVPLVLACSWFINQDVRRDRACMLSGDREVTDYGRWARHFAPGSRELFAWLRAQAGADVVVFSNFHEEIALETGIPACPTPRDFAEMEEWLARIRDSRCVSKLRALFVLDPDNDYRDYYLPSPDSLVNRFGLSAVAIDPRGALDYVLTPTGTNSAQTRGSVTPHDETDPRSIASVLLP
jgi:hypothetical protein